MTETYTEEERKIFEYSAGPAIGPRAIDPLEVLRKFTIEFEGLSLREVVYEKWAIDAPKERDGMTDEEKQLFKQDKAWVALQTAKAEQMLVDATRKIFEMESFDRATGGGATDQDVLDVLTDFLQFLS